MSEYALIGLLLVGGCLVGLLRFGHALNGQWQAFGTAMAYHPSSKITNAAPEIQATPLPAKVAEASQVSEPPSTPVKSVLSPANTASVIAVSGANGATEQLAIALESRAQAMLVEGLITTEQSNDLMELANRGHYLASGQKLLENALRNGQKTIQFEGKTYKIKDFTNILGYKRATKAKENWELNPQLASPVLKPFAEQYQAILQGGTLKNEAVKSQVTDLAIQIGALADALVWSSGQIIADGASSGQGVYSVIAGHFDDNMQGAPMAASGKRPATSVLTDGNSVKICGLGNGRDSGKNCGPR